MVGEVDTTDLVSVVVDVNRAWSSKHMAHGKCLMG